MEPLLAGIRDASLLGLQRLDLSGCGLEALPEEICRLSRLEELNLGGNSLRDLPEAFCALTSLRILFFLGNAVTTVPSVIGRLPALETLSFKSCKLSAVAPDCLPRSLRALILTSNAITALPRSIGTLTKLKKIMLAQNRLREVPEELSACTDLELIRLSNNELRAIPPALLRLPRLAWIALAGNPLAGAAPQVPVAELAMSDLEQGEHLGRGASGTVSKCYSKSLGRHVALKVFHAAAMISDGSPGGMRLCVRLSMCVLCVWSLCTLSLSLLCACAVCVRVLSHSAAHKRVERCPARACVAVMLGRSSTCWAPRLGAVVLCCHDRRAVSCYRFVEAH